MVAASVIALYESEIWWMLKTLSCFSNASDEHNVAEVDYFVRTLSPWTFLTLPPYLLPSLPLSFPQRLDGLPGALYSCEVTAPSSSTPSLPSSIPSSESKELYPEAGRFLGSTLSFS